MAANTYFDEIRNIPVLSEEEEFRLGRLLKEGTGDEAKEARDRLIVSNLRLVAYVAREYLGSGVELDEINSMGIEGLIKAVNRFDCEKGKFSNYAPFWIKQAIRSGLKRERSLIRTPRDNSDKIVVSFDAPFSEDEDSKLSAVLPDENAQDPGETVVNEMVNEKVRKTVEELKDREKRVLFLRYGFDGGEQKTLEEIGRSSEFGISREGVRQIEKKALRKLEKKLNFWFMDGR